jgi:hypothetical protein
MEQTEFTVGIHDLSTEHQQMVRETLLSILESPHFHKSKRYPALLQYVVHHTLDGNFHLLKERVIGAEVFGRPADYDNGNDAVVRSAAGEVRRRLAAYFSEHPEEQVRIDLPAGSYVAEFHFHSQPAKGESPEETQTTTGPVQSYTPPAELHSKSKDLGPGTLTARLGLALAAVLLVMVAGAAAWHYIHNRGTGEFWWPVLRDDVPALIVVGGGTDPVLTGKPAAGTNGLDSKPLELNNAIVTAQICSIFRDYKHDCKITPAQSASLADLHGKSVVLIGAFDNSWTHRLLAPLRYQFDLDMSAPAGSPRTRMIVDHDHPNNSSLWKVGPSGPSPELGSEYAIVGRFHSDITDSMVVVAAGLGPAGTRSAGEFICSPQMLHEVLSLAPKDLKGVDFEAVLQIEVIQGNAGHVKVVATQFW